MGLKGKTSQQRDRIRARRIRKLQRLARKRNRS
jgi:hypothetical protein